LAGLKQVVPGNDVEVRRVPPAQRFDDGTRERPVRDQRYVLIDRCISSGSSRYAARGARTSAESIDTAENRANFTLVRSD
jgi:hypothetical protein